MNISIVLAVVKADSTARKMARKIVMRTIRGVIPLMALQIMTGADRRVIIRHSISVRATLLTKEPEKMYTWGSFETS